MNRLRNKPSAWLPPAAALFLIGVIYATDSNHNLFLMLNRLGHAVGDNWWVNLTILGDGAVALALVLPSIRRSPQRFWAALIAAVIATLWVQGWKHMVNVPRPLSVFPVDHFFHTGPEFRAASFPSGHAAAIFALTGIWIVSLSKHIWLRLMLFLLAVLVGMSRIMVGVHWPLDVLAGMLGGWLSACAGLALAARWRLGTSSIGGFLAGLFLVVIAAALLVSRHIGYPDAIPFQRALGVLCLLWGGGEMLLMLPRRHLRQPARKE